MENIKIFMGRKWGTNYKINWDYGTNGLPIVYSKEFKCILYVTIDIPVPDYYYDLC